MDNLGCVFIMGGVVPPFATGGRAWGEFVSGGSPNPDLQRLAVHMLDLQVEYQFSLTFVWVPRDLNGRADYMSHVSEMRHHHYRLTEEWFAYLDGRLGPHTIDRFATADNCQPLCPPNAGRFCSQFFHPSESTPYPSHGRARTTGYSHRPTWWAPRCPISERAARPPRSFAQMRHGPHGGPRFGAEPAGPETCAGSSPWDPPPRCSRYLSGILGCSAAAQ